MTVNQPIDAPPEWRVSAQALADAGRFDEACHLAREALLAHQLTERVRAEQAAREWAEQHDAAALRLERERQEETAAASRAASAGQSEMRAALMRVEQMGRLMVAERDPREVLQRIEVCAAELMPSLRHSVWLLDDGGLELSLVVGADRDALRRRARVSLQAPWSAAARCARLGRELVVAGPEPFTSGRNGAAGTAVGTTLLWPLKAESRLVGVLAASAPGPALPDARQRGLVASFCAFAAVALANARTWTALSQSQARLAASERAARRARRSAARLAARQAAAMQRLSALLSAPVASLGAALAAADATAPGGPPLDQALARHAEAAATACEALDITRLEAGCVELVLEDFALDELVSDVLAAFALRRPDVPIQWAPAGPDCRVRADVAAVDRVLTTLLDAIADAADAGTALRLQVQADGGHACVKVERVGDRAAPGGPHGELLRLRLAVARELVALHGQRLRTLHARGLAYTLQLELAA